MGNLTEEWKVQYFIQVLNCKQADMQKQKKLLGIKKLARRGKEDLSYALSLLLLSGQ
jgi:hypothetical protein